MVFHSRMRRIICVGDSFERGFSFGRFSDSVSPGHPLWDIASPAHVANLLLRANDVHVRFRAGLGGLSIGSITQANLAADVASYVAAHGLTEGDWMIFEDAGQHNSDPAAYQVALEGVIDAAAPMQCAVVTAFDYPAVHGLSTEYQWDFSFSGTTMNQAKVAAANSRGALVIDENAVMDAYRTTVLAADGVDPIIFIGGGTDGIHAGPWATIKEAQLRLSRMELIGAMKSISALVSPVSANYSLLQCGATTWDAAKAEDYCEDIFA